MLLLATLALAAPQTTWFVDASAVSPGDGTVAAPYTRVDFAVAQPTTLTGDTVVVAPGVYPDERIEPGTKVVMLRSSLGPSATTLVARPGGPVVLGSGSDPLPLRMEGFTLQGGRGRLDPSDGLTYGGAVFGAGGDVRMTDCVFEDCNADRGGAIAVEPAGQSSERIVLRGCNVRPSCFASLDGGGVYARSTSVLIEQTTIDSRAIAGSGGCVFAVDDLFEASDSRFTGIAAGDGGAIYTNNVSAELLSSTITGRSTGGGRGGGIHIFGSFSGADNCRFVNCSAREGGAIYTATGFFRNSVFIDNATDDGGTGLSGAGGALFASVGVMCQDLIFIRNLAIHHPSCVGGAVAGLAIVSRSTFIANDASLDGAAHFDPAGSASESELRQILVDRAPGSTTRSISLGVSVSNSVVEDGAPGTDVIAADPSLWGPDDPHLLPDSPALQSLEGKIGALRFDRLWCGQGCDGPVGIESCPAVPGSFGVPAVLTGLGSVDVSTDRLVLNVENISSASASIMLASQTPDFVPGAGGSMGNLCVGGSILRLPGPIKVVGPQSARSFRAQLSGLAPGVAVQPGESWVFQMWYRDSFGSMPTSNFSNGLLVQF
ncbi:MAG: hypothetical protein AAGA20_15100 [Planctomycetota bacterium]